jgi:hypothetical protein
MSAPCFRMPLGYGPSPGPRQDAKGQPYTGWESSSSDIYTIMFQAPRASLSALLPHECFSIKGNGPNAFASFRLTKLKKLPWLAGRGYNHFGLYIHDVVCHSTEGDIDGVYLSVLFENMADPIITGRDELGYAKIFATLDDVWDGSNFSLSMGWEGTQWGHLAVHNLRKVSEPTEDCHTSPLFHMKYIPRTEELGTADVNYPTFTPGRVAHVSVRFEATPGSVDIGFNPVGWSMLPTLQHIVEKLASIEILGINEVKFEVQQGGHDVSSQRRIPI